MPPLFEIEIVRTEEGLYGLEGDWRRLYEESRPRNPFLSFDWAVACWDNDCPGAAPFLVTARRNGRLAGLAPLRLEGKAGFRVLRFLTAGWSEYVGFLLSPDDQGVERALLDGLAGMTGEWDILLLRRLNESYTGLHCAPAPPALRSGTAPGDISPYLSLQGDFERLLRDGPPQLRHSRRPARRWEREGGTIERLSGRELGSYVDELMAVEARSWKSREGVLWLGTGQGREVFRQALASLGVRREMELWLARLEGRLAAFQINFVTPDRVWYYYGAYDPEFRRYYPGGVLHLRAIEHAWRSGIREYDFLAGDEPYKLQWTNGVRQLDLLALYPRTPRGFLAFAALAGPKWWLKELAPARSLHHLYKLIRDRPGVLLHLLRGERVRAQ